MKLQIIKCDEDIKENVERWIEDGSSGVFDSIPSGLEEYATWEWGFFNIGKFELEEVVKPFYEKYKHLSDSEFAAQWEEDRIQTTYTFEEKYIDQLTTLLKNIIFIIN